jgi:hypothetical protein
MITSTLVAEGGRSRTRTRPTAAGSLLEELRAVLEETSATRWPSDVYRKDPVGFSRKVLGQAPWEKQCEILEAVRDYARVSVTSGHKIGKSHTAAMVAFWFYCSFPDARVVMSSTTARQVDEILWREIQRMRARSGVCVECKKAATKMTPAERARLSVPCPHSAKIDGKLGVVARSGLKASDLRQIVGFTARDPEAVAGISGENILYIVDEASGVDDPIFEAIEGNRAGGAKILLFSNPTRTEGEFFVSHHDKALQFDKDGAPVLGKDGKQVGFYKTLSISSEDSPNVRLGRVVIPGLATLDWVEEKKREWGEDSPLYLVRVKGKFALNEAGKIISLHAISVAEKAWEETKAEGRLHIGLDPAGPGEGGDETVFAARRGLKLIALYPYSGLDEDGHVRELLGILRAHRLPREEMPLVVVDREGDIGHKIYSRLRAVSDGIKAEDKHFGVIGVRSSEKSKTAGYDRVRDELWANLARWLKDGGAIVEDTKLAKELHAPAWEPVPGTKVKATAKSELRKKLERSPDRADAACLSVWESGDVAAALADGHDDIDDDLPADADLDPYGAVDFWDGGAR